MKITIGIIVVGLSMVFFYLRVAFLRGRKKRNERAYALKRRRVNGRSKGAALPTPAKGAPPFGVNSWILVAISILLIVFGLLLYNNMYILNYQLISNEAFLQAVAKYWYIAMAAGVVLLSFCLKINKPDLGDD
jgi:hypothetical protein